MKPPQIPVMVRDRRRPSEGFWRRFGSEGTDSAPLEQTTSGLPTMLDSVIPVVYGECRVYGVCHTPYRAQNSSYLYLAIVFCEGEVESIGSVEIDGEALADISWVTGIEYHTGADNQAVSPLLTTGMSGIGFVENLTGWAYIVLRVNCDDPSQIPGRFTCSAIIEGRKVYNPWTTLTEYTKNPVLCALDILTEAEVWAGKPWADVDLTSALALKNWCDEDVAGNARWEVNGIVSTRDWEEAMQQVLDVCFARRVKYNGKHHLIAYRDQAARSITIGARNWVTVPKPEENPVTAIPEVVRVKYMNPDTWVTTHVDAVVSTGIVDTDDPERLEATLDLVTSRAQALRWGQYRRRLMALVSHAWRGVADGSAADVLPGDVITIDTFDGVTNQDVYVEEIIDRTMGNARQYELVVSEYDAGVEDDDDTDEDTPVSQGYLYDAAPPTVDWERNRVYWIDTIRRGELHQYWVIDWTKPTNYQRYYMEIWVQYNAGGEYTPYARVEAEAEVLNFGDFQGEDGMVSLDAIFPETSNDWKMYCVHKQTGRYTEGNMTAQGSNSPPTISPTTGGFPYWSGAAWAHGGGTGTSTDADKVDGKDATEFVWTVGSQSMEGPLTIDPATAINSYLQLTLSTSSWRLRAVESDGTFTIYDPTNTKTPVVVKANATNNSLYIDATKVGILKNSPSVELDVNGDIAGTNITASGTVTAGGLIPGDGSELTISSAAITVTSGVHRVDTEADAATDTLSTINGLGNYEACILLPENTGRVVTIDEAGNCLIRGGTTRVLDGLVTIMYHPGLSKVIVS